MRSSANDETDIGEPCRRMRLDTDVPLAGKTGSNGATRAYRSRENAAHILGEPGRLRLGLVGILHHAQGHPTRIKHGPSTTMSQKNRAMHGYTKHLYDRARRQALS